MKYFSEESLLKSIHKNAKYLYGENRDEYGNLYVNEYESEINGCIDYMVNYSNHDHFDLQELAIIMKRDWYGTYGDCVPLKTKDFQKTINDAVTIYLELNE